jgi:hypothetical protein
MNKGQLIFLGNLNWASARREMALAKRHQSEAVVLILVYNISAIPSWNPM